MVISLTKRLLVLASILSCALAAPAYAQEELKDDRNIKKYKAISQLMTEPVYRRLGTIHTQMSEEDYDKALSNLKKMTSMSLNNHERALIEQTFGFLYVQTDRNDDALASFEKSLSYEALPGDATQGMLYSLAGLYAAEGQHTKSIETMRRWFEYEENPAAEAYMMIASSFAAMEKYPDALPYVQRAIQKAEKPNEDWYMLQLAIYVELNSFRPASELLKSMLQIWPERPKYWELLTSIYIELQEDRKALDAMMVSYNSGQIEQQERILALVQLNLLLDIPHTAGRILEAELANGNVERDKKTLDMLLLAWTDAREYSKALQLIDEIATLASDPEYYMRAAAIYNEQGNWRGVAEAASKAVAGGIEKPAEAHMLTGMAYSELERFDEALSAFAKAREVGDATQRRNAVEWSAFVQEKQQLMTSLQRD